MLKYTIIGLKGDENSATRTKLHTILRQKGDRPSKLRGKGFAMCSSNTT